MSLKPPKKSDMGKSWMKPRRDSVPCYLVESMY